MALRLGVKSLAAKFKEGGALGTYRGKWLLLSAASAEAEDRLVKKLTEHLAINLTGAF